MTRLDTPETIGVDCGQRRVVVDLQNHHGNTRYDYGIQCVLPEKSPFTPAVIAVRSPCWLVLIQSCRLPVVDAHQPF